LSSVGSHPLGPGGAAASPWRPLENRLFRNLLAANLVSDIATVAAVRYVRHSPEIRTLLLWTGCVMFFASAVLALLPIVAHRLSGGSLGYGFLLAFFGAGAVLGALLLPRLRARLSAAGILSWVLAALGVVLAAAGVVRAIGVLCGFMALGGSAWMIFISSLNTMVQQLAPSWVRARVLAVFLLVFQGSVALGSVVWASRRSTAGSRWRWCSPARERPPRFSSVYSRFSRAPTWT
jgi:MFS family permease